VSFFLAAKVPLKPKKRQTRAWIVLESSEFNLI